jgi:DtxR family Mn-dependent transcriptional regulator
MHLSNSEENYLKEIYSLSMEEDRKIPNLRIGQRLGLNPPAVTEMLRKLAEKELILYTRSEGASLTEEGEILALQVIRKHRIWETFLVRTLGFTWDEVHEVAEQLEHIRSPKLLDELDRFLGHPEFDPHGEPIPNALGIMPNQKAVALPLCRPGQKLELLAVTIQRPDFLQALKQAGISLKSSLIIREMNPEMLMLQTESGSEIPVSVSDARCMLVSECR